MLSVLLGSKLNNTALARTFASWLAENQAFIQHNYRCEVGVSEMAAGSDDSKRRLTGSGGYDRHSDDDSPQPLALHREF